MSLRSMTALSGILRFTIHIWNYVLVGQNTQSTERSGIPLDQLARSDRKADNSL